MVLAVSYSSTRVSLVQAAGAPVRLEDFLGIGCTPHPAAAMAVPRVVMGGGQHATVAIAAGRDSRRGLVGGALGTNPCLNSGLAEAASRTGGKSKQFRI